MTDKLVAKLTKLNAKLATLHSKFGEPQYKPIVLCKSRISEITNQPETYFELITPFPRTEFVKQSLIGYEVSRSIVITAKDIQVSEVVRTETENFYSKDVQYYVVDPVINAENKLVLDDRGKPIGGEQYKLIHIIDKDTTTLTLILSKIKDGYKL